MLFHVIGIGIIRRFGFGLVVSHLGNGSAPNISLVAWVGWDTGRLLVCSEKHGIDSTEPRGNDFWFSSAESPERDWHISGSSFSFFPFQFCFSSFLFFLLFFLAGFSFLLFFHFHVFLGQRPLSPFRPRREYNRRREQYFHMSFLLLACTTAEKQEQGSGMDCFSQSLTRPSHDKTAQSFRPKNFICHWIFKLVVCGRVSEQGREQAFPL